MVAMTIRTIAAYTPAAMSGLPSKVMPTPTLAKITPTSPRSTMPMPTGTSRRTRPASLLDVTNSRASPPISNSRFRAAIEIWLRELPEVPLIQYFHRIAYNTTYWTNWPTEENPYINGAQRHLTFPLLLWNLEPSQ